MGSIIMHIGKSYFLSTQLTQRGFIDMTKYIFGHVMMQMMAKAGIKHFLTGSGSSTYAGVCPSEEP